MCNVIAHSNRIFCRNLMSVVFGLLLLNACSGSKHDDLKEFVGNLEKKDAQEVKEIKPLQEYPRAVYRAQQDGLRDPFTEEVKRREVSTAQNCKKIDHAREILEDYALDALRMVGTMRKEGKLWGIVKDPNGAVHNVKIGNYLGRNNGQIRDISEGQIVLLEFVEDGMGECGWIEREASLALNN